MSWPIVQWNKAIIKEEEEEEISDNKYFLQNMNMSQYFIKNTGKITKACLNRTLYTKNNNPGCNVKYSHPLFLLAKRFKSVFCWKCGVERKNMSQAFCEKCNIIQIPLEKENYFGVFEIKETFNIDLQQLRTKFTKLQSVLHPDKFSNRTDEEKTISEEYSSLLNNAYNNLQAPLKRAEHLLNLKGEEIGESQSIDDPTFLMEIMTLNEEVDNSRNNVDKLKKCNEENKEMMANICRAIDKCFQNNDIQKAKENIIKLKYFTSVNNRINGILRELGIID